MLRTSRMLAHHSWIESLGSYESERDPRWAPDVATFLVVRHFRQWALKPVGPRPNRTIETRLLERIAQIPLSRRQLRDRLTRIVNTMRDVLPSPLTVHPDFIAIAELYSADGSHALAADILETLITALEKHHHRRRIVRKLMAMTYYRLGCAQTEMGELWLARGTFDLAFQAAERAGDRELALRSEIWAASLARMRGELGSAETVLNILVAKCDEAGLRAPLALAYRTRASTRHLRGNYHGAIIDACAALRLPHDTPARDAMIADLAVFASDAGYWTLARSILRRTVKETASAVTRGYATVNLLELAVKMGDELEFWKLRRTLADMPLSGFADCFRRIYLAQGVLRFRGAEAAAPYFEQALAHARQSNAHQVEHLALEGIETLGKAPERPEEQQAPCEISDLVARTLAAPTLIAG